MPIDRRWRLYFLALALAAPDLAVAQETAPVTVPPPAVIETAPLPSVNEPPPAGPSTATIEEAPLPPVSDEPEAPLAPVAPSPALEPETSPAAATPAPAPPAPPLPEPAAAEPEPPAAPLAKRLKVAVPEGAYGAALRAAVFAPFEKEASIGIDNVALPAAIAPLAADATLGWDVANLPVALAERACDLGLVVPVDAAQLARAPDGTAAGTDYLPGGLVRCGVAGLAWSSVVLVDDQANRAMRGLETINDFFDVRRFPGKRGLPKGTRYVLEMALLADGVLAEDVYTTLGTEAGMAQAFAKLETLRRHIVWIEKPEEALTLLVEKKVVASVAFSGRAFYALSVDLRPYRLVWDGQIYDTDMWVAAKSSPMLADAARFIAFASDPQRLADQASQFPYGPMRRSAIALVGRHQTLGIDLTPFLPTAPQNFGNALKFDPVWWSLREIVVEQRMDAWLAKGVVPAKPAATTKRRKKTG